MKRLLKSGLLIIINVIGTIIHVAWINIQKIYDQNQQVCFLLSNGVICTSVYFRLILTVNYRWILLSRKCLKERFWEVPDEDLVTKNVCFSSMVSSIRVILSPLDSKFKVLSLKNIKKINFILIKIDQEKTELWGERELSFLCAACRSLIFLFQFWPLVFKVS